ncbi:SDR family oxidoreductase [Bacillus sp. FJAT-45350]|uniref:SDR family oxidoreductase n=1 Tax=Bacillus sp. FJAT-45350 TaxID=2011014 RepID=UPI000BB8A4E9|nr:SDR family oxidoreductase [Bacillus sp. FJAT-45350]
MRHAFITSGAKGLGLKVTDYFLENDYTVTVNFRSDKNAVERLKERWSNKVDRIHIVQGDITKKQDIVRMVQEAYERFGRIDILVNNAGPYIFERKKLMDYTEDEWYEMIEGNLSACFHMFKEVIPIMRKQRFGRIVTYGFQSVNDAPGWIYRSAYAAAKVGLVSLMKTVSLEEAENGITINMVSPGHIMGDMKETTIEKSRLIKDENTPVGRSGTGEDIARTVAFLCEDNADMITGTVIDVTGGVNVIHRYR